MRKGGRFLNRKSAEDYQKFLKEQHDIDSVIEEKTIYVVDVRFKPILEDIERCSHEEGWKFFRKIK